MTDEIVKIEPCEFAPPGRADRPQAIVETARQSGITFCGYPAAHLHVREPRPRTGHLVALNRGA